MTEFQPTAWFTELWNALAQVNASTLDGRISLFQAANAVRKFMLDVHAGGNKVMFIGNGGSAAIASHMATDFSKNGDIRALALNDAATLTCLGNDLGYENVFAHQVAMQARKHDLLVAISSSGQSQNILNAVATALDADVFVVTLSGFKPDNPLRKKGDWNFYVPSESYGIVETAHLSILHSILDSIVQEKS